MKLNNKTSSILSIIVIISIFLLVSFIVQRNLDFINQIIGNNVSSMFIFVLVFTLMTVIAPISAMPIVPIASNIWGPFISAILSTIGWMLGAFIAFSIARRFGVPICSKFLPMKKISEIEKKIPKQNLFLSIVFFRMIGPVDLVSYAFGLFSNIKTSTYMFATLIGILPFAIAFSYLGNMPIIYQISALIITVIVILIGLFIKKNYTNKNPDKIL